MRRPRRSIRLFVIVAFLFAGTLPGAPPVHVESVDSEVLVKFQPGASRNDIDSVGHGADVDRSERVAATKSGEIWRLHSRSMNTEALSAALQHNPRISYVEPNYIIHVRTTPTDTSYAQQWALKNSGQTADGVPGFAGADIRAESAWSVTTGSQAIVVGVVDTGIDYTHPDLAANIWSNPGGKGNSLCAAGTHGFNAIAKTCDPLDANGHGTHVAGTIGASGNNSLGVSGVNWTTSIMALRFLDQYGNGTTADAIAAIDFAIQAKIDGVNVRVLNNSWGDIAFSKALYDEVNKAGENDILFVASAGNDSQNNDNYPHYPAGYPAPNVISVAATDNRDRLPYFSDFGSTTVHLGAPGVSILSTYRNGGYTSLSGTSMAAPHVSGVAALVLSSSPSLTTAQVKAAILDNVDPIPSLSGLTVTGGRLNAARAVGLPAQPDFSVTVTPSSVSVVPGYSASYSVMIAPTAGFTSSVDLSVTGLPAGASATFDPTPATTSSTLTITTSNTTPVGSSSLTITGASGGLVRGAGVLLSVTTPPGPPICPQFRSPLRFGLGGTPSGLAAGDFNGDGRPDIVTTLPDINRVVVGLNVGSGSISLMTAIVAPGAPIAVAAADFNGDGKADLAIANSGSSSISILQGRGDGSFMSAVNFAAGTAPFALATGDFNGDGKIDVAVANNGSGNVSVLIGNGDGTFAAPVNYSAGSGPYLIVAGDVNGDGKTDLVVVDRHSNAISVLIGNGNGTFQTAVNYATGSAPTAVAMGDFNRDGVADLVASNSSSNDISVFIGRGDGTFSGGVRYAAANGPQSVAALDADDDGITDVVVTCSTSVGLLLGVGDGTFGPATMIMAPVAADSLAVADVDGDGRPDLIMGTPYDYYYSYYYSGYVLISRNGGVCSLNCGAMTAGSSVGAGTAPQSVFAADLNGDGKVDLAVANEGSDTVSIANGAGDGSFGPAIDYNAGSAPWAVKAADLDSDGKLDLVIADSGSGKIAVLKGTAGGAFLGAVGFNVGTNPHALVFGDFNGDGRIDVAVANNGSSDVTILPGNGDGTLQPGSPVAAGTNPESIVAGDFNRDGKLDLAVASAGSNDVSILIGKGDGTFQSAVSVAAGTAPMSLVAGDFNRDGKLDLTVANSGSNNVSILLGDGTGGFATAVDYAAGTAPYGVVAGDFDADGIVDLAVSSHGTNQVIVLRGRTNGTFSAGVPFSSGTAPFGLAIADLNRDGKADLAVANSGSNNVSILLDTCPVTDLTIAMTRSGPFSQGDVGRFYTITVTNSGMAPVSAPVSVIDTIPTGLIATAISGSGWTCTVRPVTCSRTDALAAGASYPPITVTVNVSNSAPGSVTNSATVAGGAEVDTSNDTATDTAAVVPLTDLVITSNHIGNFTQGAAGKIYTIIVRNAGGLASAGTVTVTDTLPPALNATSMSGSGWSCLGLTCTRSDALAAGTAYPPLTLVVDVAANAPASVTNTAIVSGGGESSSSNDTALDPTVIWSHQTCGAFGSPANVAGVGSGPFALGDFNGDGKTDMVSTGYGNVSVLLGHGDGTFEPAVSYTVAGSPTAIAVADLNGDGKPDLIVLNNSYPSTVGVLLGLGDGTFAPASSNSTASNYANSLVINDFNGDGKADVLVTYGSGGSIIMLLGNGDGTLQPAVSSNIGGYPGFAVAADFDGDGKIDLAIADSGAIQILRGNGDGSFQTKVPISLSSSPSSIGLGDFNGDGKPDLAAVSSYDYGVMILIGNGDASFQAPVTYSTSYSYGGLAIDDIDGDGNLDILVTGWSIQVLHGRGDGTFGTPASNGSNYYGSQLAVADFNGDGKADVVVAGSSLGGLAIARGGCPDLTITKTHSGNFTAGLSSMYTIVVKNSGEGATSGPITVTDTLPAGLTATSIYGGSWSCTLANLTCTYNYSLPSGSSSDVIYLYVAITKDAPSTVTNTATVSGGSDANTSNNTASDPTTIVRAADLTVSCTHYGTFSQGDIGRTYTIVVGNAGAAATTGTVILRDTLPSYFSATAMSGAGWSCDVGVLTCTRSDVLQPGDAYPAVTLTVNTGSGVQYYGANTATVSGGGETNTANDTASDPTTVFYSPTTLVVTPILTTQISLTWTAVYGAPGYQILRSTDNRSYSVVGTAVQPNYVQPTYVDSSVMRDTVYFYRVRAADSTAQGPLSPIDFAVTTPFTDNPIVAGQTTIKAAHLRELRTAVGAFRAAASLPPFAFADPAPEGVFIRAVHIAELRTALIEAFNNLGFGSWLLTGSTPAAGDPIRAADIQALRSAVK